MKPPKTNYLILILLALLFIGVAAKAENAKPHIVYVDSKDSVKMQLQVKIAMQEIQIKELMAEKQKANKSNLLTCEEGQKVLFICLMLLIWVPAILSIGDIILNR
jgi:hypothetical protein